MTARHVIVKGRVQGVGFRAFTRDAAERHGIKGWVRNREDGTVEAHIEGPETCLTQMLADLRSGPGASAVSDVQVTRADPESPVDFEIRR